MPSIVAPHYPLNKGWKWYEGTDLRMTSQLVGRTEALDSIMQSLQIQKFSSPRLIAVTGIGGIGYDILILRV